MMTTPRDGVDVNNDPNVDSDAIEDNVNEETVVESEESMTTTDVDTETDESPEPNTGAHPTSDYFADDEELVSGAVSEERDFAVFPEGTGMVSWEIAGLYDADGKQNKPGLLKNDPPILRVKSSDGGEAEFLLSRDFSSSMASAIDDVRRAHAGMTVKRGLTRTRESAAENINNLGKSIAAQPLKYGLLGLILVLAVAAFLMQMF